MAEQAWGVSIRRKLGQLCMSGGGPGGDGCPPELETHEELPGYRHRCAHTHIPLCPQKQRGQTTRTTEREEEMAAS